MKNRIRPFVFENIACYFISYPFRWTKIQQPYFIRSSIYFSEAGEGITIFLHKYPVYWAEYQNNNVISAIVNLYFFLLQNKYLSVHWWKILLRFIFTSGRKIEHILYALHAQSYRIKSQSRFIIRTGAIQYYSSV